MLSRKHPWTQRFRKSVSIIIQNRNWVCLRILALIIGIGGASEQQKMDGDCMVSVTIFFSRDFQQSNNCYYYLFSQFEAVHCVLHTIERWNKVFAIIPFDMLYELLRKRRWTFQSVSWVWLALQLSVVLLIFHIFQPPKMCFWLWISLWISIDLNVCLGCEKLKFWNFTLLRKIEILWITQRCWAFRFQRFKKQ